MVSSDNAKAYARERYVLFFIGTAVTFFFLIVYQLTFSGFFKSFAFSVQTNFYIATTIYIALFSLLHYAVSLPAHYYSSYMLEHKFSLSNQNLYSWGKDELKKGIISFLIFLCIINIFYFLLRLTGGLWWIWLAAFWVLFTVIFTRLVPTLIIPLFYKYSVLENANLKKRIKDTAKKAAIDLIDIFQIDFSKKTKKANAAVVGMGKSRRVLLADTLLTNFSDDEIESVCAHEFAHHKLYHMLKHIIFSSVLTAVGFYILSLLMQRIVITFHADAIYDLKIFPSFMIVLFIFNFFMMPVDNAFSRMLEKEADMLCLDLTGNPQAFIHTMDKLARMNLSDRNPPKIIKHMFYSHPPISERIEMANGKAKMLHRNKRI